MTEAFPGCELWAHLTAREVWTVSGNRRPSCSAYWTCGRSFRVQDELWYQPIAYRWAQNLGPYDTKETNRFVTYYDLMSDVSGTVLATGATTME
jgi:hypothetical protein